MLHGAFACSCSVDIVLIRFFVSTGQCTLCPESLFYSEVLKFPDLSMKMPLPSAFLLEAGVLSPRSAFGPTLLPHSTA